MASAATPRSCSLPPTSTRCARSYDWPSPRASDCCPRAPTPASSAPRYLRLIRRPSCCRPSGCGRRSTLDADDATAVVDAGTRLSELNAAAAAHGLELPIDLAADPAIGGMIATNTGGARVLRYGPMRRHLLAVEVIAADDDGLGARLATRAAQGQPRHRRRPTGDRIGRHARRRHGCRRQPHADASIAPDVVAGRRRSAARDRATGDARAPTTAGGQRVRVHLASGAGAHARRSGVSRQPVRDQRPGRSPCSPSGRSTVTLRPASRTTSTPPSPPG